MTALERSSAKRRDQKTAAAMLAAGSTNRQIADHVGRSTRQVSRWKAEGQFVAMVEDGWTEQERHAVLQRDQRIAAAVLARSGTCRDAAASAARSVSVVSGWLHDPAFTAMVAEARQRQANAVACPELAP